MALLNNVIFHILKCTVLNLNDISTKGFSESIYFINCKKCDNLTIGITVNKSIFSCYIIKNFILFFRAIFLTGYYHDGYRFCSTD